jgi:hypothetical protein
MTETFTEVEGWTPTGEEWPLLFRHQEEIDGPEFKVHVTILGRLLATVDAETGSCWIDGVYPGSICAHGDNLTLANASFRRSMREILQDLMESVRDIDDFRANIKSFLQTTDDVTISAWKAALDKVRSGTHEGAPNLQRYDASDWAEYAMVEDRKEVQAQPIMAIPAPVESNLLAAA